MLSLASLLNPAPPGPSVSRFRSSPVSSSPASSYADEYSSFMERHLLAKHTMTSKDIEVFTKSKAKGAVNFRPFEDLDDASLREVKKFQVYPFGKIQDFCRHIPYNSGKKDFYEKTGRESFEVFQYIFKVPEDESEYTVMWDYNVGLVRMTPFFKCCKYSKTMPAKMLNMNPGLRDITHSITGGSIMAQGYWMPYACAKAICATFCQPIAGALIPIFGPDFPSQCVSIHAPEHGRMTIDHSIVAESTREAEGFRRMYAAANHHYPALPSPTSLPSPRSPQHTIRSQPYDYNRSQPRSKRVREMDSPDTAGDVYSSPELGMGKSNGRHGGYMVSSIPPLRNTSGWTAANHTSFHHNREEDYQGANPWLSAVPRISGSVHHGLPLPTPPTQTTSWTTKRLAEADVDCKYDADESQNGNSPTTGPRADGRDDEEVVHNGADKNAAFLLMHLSVRDRQKEKIIRTEASTLSSPPLNVEHRSKRRRATSL